MVTSTQPNLSPRAKRARARLNVNSKIKGKSNVNINELSTVYYFVNRSSTVQFPSPVNELRAHFPDAWVEPGYRELIPVMTNQEKDRHVLAAAVKTPCEVIVTYNLKDFPEESLKPFGIEVKHPDEFLIDLYHIDGELVVHELHEQGAALHEPRTIGEVLESLETCKCTQFAQLIREKLSL